MFKFNSSNLFAFALIAMLAVTACGEIFDTGDNFVKANIGGDEKEWTGVLVNAINVDTINGVLIEAIKTVNVSNIEQLTLGLADFDGAGTYVIDLESSNLGTYSYTGTDSTFQSITSSGTIEVTNYEDNILEGTFTLNLVDLDQNNIDVKDGSFKVKVIE
ncbi:MAG: hypothetical protein ACPGLV_05165 [Bacteroidia bacterium]